MEVVLIKIRDRKGIVIATLILLSALLLFGSHRLLATQVIIDDIQITEDSGCSEILIWFNFPVRYVKHFPYEFGDDLRIKIQPIVTGPEERDALFTREPVIPPPNELAGLSKVLYEGDVPDGPFLTLFFDETVAFQVGQGADFRSLVIMVTAPDNPEPCRISQ